MKVVEKDNLVHEMLREELDRCRNMSASLVKMLAGLAKGSLHVRYKKYKGRRYVYHYLKYREGKKNYSKHVSAGELEKVSKELDVRKKYMSELSSYRARIKYLGKILSVKK